MTDIIVIDLPQMIGNAHFIADWADFLARFAMQKFWGWGPSLKI
jgi:hypothetical protein